MAQPNSVYDREANDDPAQGRLAPSDEGLRHMTGISPEEERGMEERAGLKHQEAKATPGYYKPDDIGKSAEDPEKLSKLENKVAGGLYSAAGGGDSLVNKLLKSKNKKWAAIGASVVLGIGGGLVGIFLALIPLKVEHIVNNLEHRFYATSEDATKKESERLFQQYMITRVFPAFRNCGSTIDKRCSAKRTPGTSPVAHLYNSWKDARLENKLAGKKYGIEFARKGDTWYIKYPGATGDGINIGKNGESWDKTKSRADYRKLFNTAFDNAFENETGWKKILLRYQAGGLQERKSGIKRCLVVCKLTDPIHDNIDAQKRIAKTKLVERVIIPQNEALGIALKCIINGCDVSKADTTDPDAGNNGAPENQLDVDESKNLRDFGSKTTSAATLEAAEKYISDADEQGTQQVVLKSVLSSISGVDAATAASTTDLAEKAIPIFGWANLIAKTVHVANNAGPVIDKASYVVKVGAAISLYRNYRTYADEIHTGNVTPTEVGSMVDSLGSGDQGSTDKNLQLGGTASAEQAPLYNRYIGHEQTIKTTALLDSILPGKAYAASANQTSPPDYKCNDGKSPPPGQICSEEVFAGGNGAADAVHNFLNQGDAKYLTQISDLWVGTVGAVFDFAGGVVSSAVNPLVNVSCGITSGIPFGGIITSALPGGAGVNAVCQIKDLTEKYLPQAAGLLVNALIPNPFGPNMSGGRKLDMMAGGADAEGNDYAHSYLGGKMLNPDQVATIVNDQQQEDQASFSRQPLFARMFSTDDPDSLTSKVAMAMPLNTQAAAQNNFASIINNPFGALTHSFGAILAGKASAAETAQADPFGIIQYGYSDDEIPKDPEAYWDAHCSDNPDQAYQNDKEAQDPKTNWNGAAANNVDKKTGTAVNNKTNACLLIKAAVGADGGIYDKSNLTDNDLALGGQAPSDSGSGDNNTTAVSGDAQQLAKQILANKKIVLTGRLVAQDIQAAANGQKGSAGAKTNTAILQLIATIGQNHSVVITAIQSGGTGHSSGSAHYSGNAVDFGSLDGSLLSGRDGGSKKIIQIAIGVLPSGSAFGQSNCGSTPSLPKGFTTFSDTCNHLHVQVP